MKKTLSIILMAAVVLCALAVFASCGGKATIDGEWKTDIDISKMLSEAEALSVDVSGKTVEVVLNFKTDGKCAVNVNMEQYKAVMSDVFKSSIEASAAALGGTVDDYLALFGASNIDELVEMMFDEEDDVANEEGEYTLEGDVLTLNGNSFKIDLSSSKLVLKELVSGEDDDLFSSSSLPITFTRK